MPRKATYSPLKALPRYAKTNDDPRARQAKRAHHTGSKQWRAMRARHLANERFCRECRPRLVVGNHVDHIDGDSSNTDPLNLQTLCHSHHSTKTAKYDGGFGNVRRIRSKP